MKRRQRSDPKPKLVYLDCELDQFLDINGGYAVLVPWYLITSHLYYHRNISIITDEKFDWICKKLKKYWKVIKHPHKKLIDKGALSAGTGYYLKEEDIPSVIKYAGITLHQKFLRLNKLYKELSDMYVPRVPVREAKQVIKRRRRK